MPEMDGVSATWTIGGLSALESLPIIALTGNALAGRRENCLAAGKSFEPPISMR